MKGKQGETKRKYNENCISLRTSTTHQENRVTAPEKFLDLIFRWPFIEENDRKKNKETMEHAELDFTLQELNVEDEDPSNPGYKYNP